MKITQINNKNKQNFGNFAVILPKSNEMTGFRNDLNRLLTGTDIYGMGIFGKNPNYIHVLASGNRDKSRLTVLATQIRNLIGTDEQYIARLKHHFSPDVVIYEDATDFIAGMNQNKISLETFERIA